MITNSTVSDSSGHLPGGMPNEIRPAAAVNSSAAGSDAREPQEKQGCGLGFRL